MTERTVKMLPLLLLGGVLLGALCGYFLPQVGLALGFLGQLFVGGLRLLMVPLLVAGTITGVAAFGELRRIGGAVSAMSVYFLATSVAAVVIAIGAALLFAPEAGFVGMAVAPITAPWSSLTEALGGVIPGNLFQAVVQGKYLGVAIGAVLLGGVLASMGLRGRTVVTFFKGLHEGLLQVVKYVMYVAPLGVFSLVAAAVAGSVTSPVAWSAALGSYLLASLIALAVYGLVVLPVAVWYFGGRLTWSFFGELSPALLTAFGTSSKAATFPVTYQCLVEKSRIDHRSVSTVLPVGTGLGLDGTSIMMTVGTLFAAHAFGLSVGIGGVLLVAWFSIVVSVAAAGMPSAWLIAAPALFGVVGLTAEQAAVAVAGMATLDWLIDRVRAMVNVASDATACTVVAKTLETRAAIRPPRARRPERPDRETGEPVRERTGYRPGSYGDRRRRGGPMGGRDRSRREESGVGRPAPVGGGFRPRPENDERSPFQMKAGRTPALGIDRDRPAQAPERPAPAREERRDRDERHEREERREPRRPFEASGETRRPRGRYRPGAERPETGIPRRPVEPPTETPSAAGEASRLKREVVARELSRVSAQLREPEQEPKPQPETVTQPEEASADLPPGPEEETPFRHGQNIDDELPDNDADVDDGQQDIFGAPEFETPGAVEAADDSQESSKGESGESDTSEEASFGRGRHFKGAAFRNAEAPSLEETKETPDEPAPPEFPSEDVSFGRIKRKRIR